MEGNETTNDGVPPGKLRVVVTFLEMHAAPAGIDALREPPEPGLRVEATTTMGVPAYRRLYDGIGEAWL